MVTTFSARLVSLTNKCNSIIGKRKSLDIDSIDINNTQNHQRHNYSAMKRQGTFDIEPRHPRHHSSDSPSHKRKKQKEEIQYNASTIQSALQAAGYPPVSILEHRRERALPMGWVNLDAAKVIFSSEYDKQSVPEFDENLVPSIPVSNSDAALECDACSIQDEVPYDWMDYTSLIMSTRTYYKSHFRTTPTSTFTVSNTNLKRSKNVNNDVDKNSDSSECVSSWTPSSDSNDLMIYKKNIDNDNRSDDISSVAAEDSSSESSLCQSPLSPQVTKEDGYNERRNNSNCKNNSETAFTVVG